MRRLFLLILPFLAIALHAQTTEKDSVCYDMCLEDFVVYAPSHGYQAGAKIEKISSDLLDLSQSGGIDNLLMRFTPVYIKSNAGGLSTIRLRGTSADHTSVMFGGLNVNSLTLGSSDMSSIPSYLFDELDLQYGSSSVMDGSGAIGGAVRLGLEEKWTNGIRVSATTNQGSFGEELYGAKVFVGNGAFEFVTRAYLYQKENDFPFPNTEKIDFVTKEPKADTQYGARIKNMGVLQQLNYRFHKKEYIRTAFWWEHDWHEIQLKMNVNDKSQFVSDLDNHNIRLWTEYNNNRHDLKFRFGSGYVHDMQLQDGDQDEPIGSDRVVNEVELNRDYNKNLGFRLGATHKFIVPDVHAYSDSNITNEQHLDIYLSSFLVAFNRMKMTLNLRQMLHNDYSIPFTPSLGIDYRFINKEKTVLKTSANISRSYRIPTFNDRFWGEQGNPDLKPEDGINYEIAENYAYCSSNFQYDVKLNAFYMDVKNWIQWQNITGWMAVNLMEVESKGLELSQKLMWKILATRFNANLNFTYNEVEAVKTISTTGVVGRQIMYVPKQMGNVYLSATYKDWVLALDGSYTGIRYDEDYEQMDPYYLANVSILKKTTYRKQSLLASFSVNNVLDKSYQNQRLYAMPGRNYRISLTINFNKIK